MLKLNPFYDNKFSPVYRNKFNYCKYGGTIVKLDRENFKYGLNPLDYDCFDEFGPDDNNESSIQLDLKDLKDAYDKCRTHKGEIKYPLYKRRYTKKKKRFMRIYDIDESGIKKLLKK